MTWETFNKANRWPPRSSPEGMTARFYKANNVLALSDDVAAVLGTEFVELLYDRDGGRMALRPTTSDSRVAYRLRRMSKGRGWIISLMAFMRRYAIDGNSLAYKRFALVHEGDLFVIDLTRPLTD